MFFAFLTVFISVVTPVGYVKARLHMRFLMRFLMRFRVRNAPDPTLHECLFREASCGLERKVSHIILRHPSFEFLPTWQYFVAALCDYKPVRGRLGQILFAKSHQNRIENRMCKRAFTTLFGYDKRHAIALMLFVWQYPPPPPPYCIPLSPSITQILKGTCMILPWNSWPPPVSPFPALPLPPSIPQIVKGTCILPQNSWHWRPKSLVLTARLLFLWFLEQLAGQNRGV